MYLCVLTSQMLAASIMVCLLQGHWLLQSLQCYILPGVLPLSWLLTAPFTISMAACITACISAISAFAFWFTSEYLCNVFCVISSLLRLAFYFWHYIMLLALMKTSHDCVFIGCLCVLYIRRSAALTCVHLYTWHVEGILILIWQQLLLAAHYTLLLVGYMHIYMADVVLL